MTSRGDFPAGTYFSALGSVRADAGGQTRVMLMRHRLLAGIGIDVPILTFDARTSYPEVRAALRADGLLLPSSRLLNMHEDLAERDLSTLPTADVPATEHALLPHHRSDGSVYARIPQQGVRAPHVVLDRDGRSVAAPSTLAGLWRWWVRLLTADADRVFVLSDSRYVAQVLSTTDDPSFYVLHQVHNPHTTGARSWSSPVSRTYQGLVGSISRLDALSLLTGRQAGDVARRFGATDNLAVVPNPVEPVGPPDATTIRTPGRIMMVARLTPQKRVDRAVAAFAQVAAHRPEARLDVYGDGPLRQDLERQVEQAGLTGLVRLHGYEPHAADRFWEADLCWSTSDFEGYPLVVLEAMARGCPVVACDAPYGPREQITHGVDGALVPAGDAAAVAAATVDLLADREWLERMRGAALAAAAAHSTERFMADWAALVTRAVAAKPHRTRLRSVQPEVDLRTRGGRLAVVGRLEVHGHGELTDAVVRWQVFGPGGESPRDLPLTTEVKGSCVTVHGSVPLGTLTDAPTMVTVRLLLEWRNSAWQHDLVPGGLELAVGRRGRVDVVHRDRTMGRVRRVRARLRRLTD